MCPNGFWSSEPRLDAWARMSEKYILPDHGFAFEGREGYSAGMLVGKPLIHLQGKSISNFLLHPIYRAPKLRYLKG